MLFSIIIPVFNTAKYLDKCIESVKGQTFSDWELIIVDDGSTDESAQICDIYAQKDERIRVLHKENEGQGKARNVAIGIAKGDYIVFLDSDDWLELNLLETLNSLLIEEKEVDLVSYQFNIFNERRILTSKPNKKYIKQVLDNHEVWKEFLNGEQILGFACNKCIKRKIIIENNLRFPQTKAREDICFALEIIKYIKKAIITDFRGYNELLRYGSTENSVINKDFMISIRHWNMARDYIEMVYPDLFRNIYIKAIKAKISLISAIVADGKEKSMGDEYIQIKKELAADMKVIEDWEEARGVYDILKNISQKSLKWTIEQKIVGIERYTRRIKRYLYYKIF